ncbi:uncharacterized protein LOC111793656 isoform X2 [Cucurbita pepo subsp. pepo]|uniref:uncharacterized protein LOC111793656 isoform X2 n=1 Tax=Cucurbita pepo subsp. pepo TaxID=3664 RepID=UPI000C9D93A1|nr:uncharacterized protein LOC111793656 isoform X2 [Cucurbita pepo subsp. pepo]
MSSSIRSAWVVAASVGVVEALKDQGICRWNNVLRSAQFYAKNHVGSVSQAKKFSSSAAAAAVASGKQQNQSEESLRTVMYLSCWGPNN